MNGICSFSKESNSGEALSGWVPGEGCHWGLTWVTCFKFHMLAWYLALCHQTAVPRWYWCGLECNATFPSRWFPDSKKSAHGLWFTWFAFSKPVGKIEMWLTSYLNFMWGRLAGNSLLCVWTYYLNSVDKK